MGATRRVTVQEAARIMGVSEGAVRKRVKRNTLRHDKEQDGRVYVYLEGATRGVDDRVDEVSHPVSNALISEMRERIAFLERELERKDAIMLNMTEAMKAIAPPPQEETPPQPPGGPREEATEQPGRVGAQPAVEGAQEPSEPLRATTEVPIRERRPWWRFWE